MVAVAMLELERTVSIVVAETWEMDIVCPRRRDDGTPCGRHLGSVLVYGNLTARRVWTKRQCPSCRKWTWFDAATGEPFHRPQGPD